MAKNADGTVTIKTKGKTSRLKDGGGGSRVSPSTPPSSRKQVGVKGKTIVGKGKKRN